MKKTCFILAIVLLLNIAYASEKMRTWTSMKGTKVPATLIKDEGSIVILKTRDGRTVRIKRSSLSKSDNAYLESRSKTLANNRSGATSDWPGWLGPDRNGKSRDTGLIKKWPEDGPTLLWKTTGLGEGFSGVAVANGHVYITGGVNGKLKIFSYDMKGKEAWSTNHGPMWSKSYPGSRATVQVSDGKLYLMSGEGTLSCYDASKGDEIWTRKMGEFGGRAQGWGYSESVLIVDDTLYVSPGGKTTMAALDKKTGRSKWESDSFKGAAEYSSAIYAVHDGVPMIINANESGLYALNPSNGSLFWSNDFCARNTANCPTPAYKDGLVLCSNGTGKRGKCLKLKALGKRG
ncbi:hypothetical protein BVX94_00180, partial [bacterium B17]